MSGHPSTLLALSQHGYTILFFVYVPVAIIVAVLVTGWGRKR